MSLSTETMSPADIYAVTGGGYSRRGYSRDDGAKEEAMQKLNELMNETSDNSVRMAIQKAMDEMQ